MESLVNLFFDLCCQPFVKKAAQVVSPSCHGLRYKRADDKRSQYLPEVVDFAVDERLVLPLDVVDVFDVAGVQVLLHDETQETVVGSVSCRKGKFGKMKRGVQQ